MGNYDIFADEKNKGFGKSEKVIFFADYILK